MKSINWRYALGEIIIVIIGISLAFSLNNWKESSAERRQRQQYLSALELDIVAEIDQLEQLQTTIGQRLGQIQQMSSHIGFNRPGKDSVLMKVFEIGRAVSFQPDNITYQTLVNSGDLKLIDDFELRRAIEAHYSEHNEVLRNYERLDNIYASFLGDYFVRSVDYGAIRQGDFSSIDTELFRNILYSLMGGYQLAFSANETCLESNRDLLEMIAD
ncbi:MAG: DUF6090 family protein [Bacteroidota bacterium]